MISIDSLSSYATSSLELLFSLSTFQIFLSIINQFIKDLNDQDSLFREFQEGIFAQF